MRILVLSTFDVWPPRDGGQNRYVNLWRNFSPEHEITILAYEFRNLLAERRYRLADHVEVIVPIASESDAQQFYRMQAQTGLWLHDVLCLSNYHFSASFLRNLTQRIRSCDVLVASHPYLATLAFPIAPDNVVRVYESHNVEFDIKKEYFSNSRDATLANHLISVVETGERYAARQSDYISAVSQADKSRLIEMYDLESRSINIVPNGANVGLSCILGSNDKQDVRALLDLQDAPLGIFVGSSFAANVESYKRGRLLLEAAGFRGTMLLVGAIAHTIRDDWPRVGFEERWLGFVSTDTRDVLLSTANFALHLIFSGAGTNLKLFDYMMAGVPIITNDFGRRGVEADGWCWSVTTALELEATISTITSDEVAVKQRVDRARCIAAHQYDWKHIAKRFELEIGKAFNIHQLDRQPDSEMPNARI